MVKTNLFYVFDVEEGGVCGWTSVVKSDEVGGRRVWSLNEPDW